MSRVRTREVPERIARRVFAEFETCTAKNTERAETTSADVMTATQAVRQLDLTLRTANVLNRAIAQRINAVLMTFDEKMTVSAKALRIPVAAA
jgi:hypothetical protein